MTNFLETNNSVMGKKFFLQAFVALKIIHELGDMTCHYMCVAWENSSHCEIVYYT